PSPLACDRDAWCCVVLFTLITRPCRPPLSSPQTSESSSARRTEVGEQGLPRCGYLAPPRGPAGPAGLGRTRERRRCRGAERDDRGLRAPPERVAHERRHLGDRGEPERRAVGRGRRLRKPPGQRVA